MDNAVSISWYIIILQNRRLTQSCRWVELTHGLGWIGSTIAIVLKIWSANSALSRLTDNSCIELGRVGPNFFPLVVGWVGLSQSVDGLGWIGSHKMDPWTTLA